MIHRIMSAAQESAGYLLSGFTDKAISIMAAARNKASELRNQCVEPEHVLWALSSQDGNLGRVILDNLGMDFISERPVLEELLGALPVREARQFPLRGPATLELLRLAKDQASILGHHFVGVEHLLLGILRIGTGSASEFLTQRGISVERFQEELMRHYRLSKPGIIGRLVHWLGHWRKK